MLAAEGMKAEIADELDRLPVAGLGTQAEFAAFLRSKTESQAQQLELEELIHGSRTPWPSGT